MAKGASARAAARRQKDKWKAKRWFSIRAPRNPWSFKIIGETLAEDEKMLIGRHYEIMQNELDGDFTKMHNKIRFRVVDVIGNDAITEFIGHDMMKDYVRRQIRRDRGKIDDAIDVVTDDGFYVRIKPMMVTRSRVRGSQKQESRTIARNTIIKFCAKSTWISVQKSLLDGSLEEDVLKTVSKIQPLRIAFFRRSQLIQSGVVVNDGPTLEEIISEEESSVTKTPPIEESQSEFDEDIPETSDEDDSLDSDLSEVPVDESEIDTVEVENDISETEEPPESTDLSNLLKKLKPELVEISKNLNLEHTGTKINLIERIYNSQNVSELKKLLKDAGKPVSGKKSDLISRLME